MKLESLEDFQGVEIDGRFQIRAPLGEGAMGMVFRARQTSVNRDVALKVMRLEHFRDDTKIKRFQREIEVVSNLSHPNIVRLYDSGEDHKLGLFFIVMELVEGFSLERLLYGTPTPQQPSLELALEIVYQICGALSEPHQVGIVHRDMKPENILLSVASDGTLMIKVVDFGVARIVQPDEDITKAGKIVGTPSYMAPEAIKAADIDGRTDLYGVGVMLYEMLTGRLPFTADVPLNVVIKHVKEQPPPMTGIAPGLARYPEVVRLVEDMLAKGPEDRPRDALDVRRRIDDIQDHYNLRRLRLEAGKPLMQTLMPWMLGPERPGPSVNDEHQDAADTIESSQLMGFALDDATAVLPPDIHQQLMQDKQSAYPTTESGDVTVVSRHPHQQDIDTQDETLVSQRLSSSDLSRMRPVSDDTPTRNAAPSSHQPAASSPPTDVPGRHGVEVSSADDTKIVDFDRVAQSIDLNQPLPRLDDYAARGQTPPLDELATRRPHRQHRAGASRPPAATPGPSSMPDPQLDSPPARGAGGGPQSNLAIAAIVVLVMVAAVAAYLLLVG